MGSKIKHRQERKPRNYIAMDMILNNKGGPMRHRADRRPKEGKDVRRHVNEWDTGSRYDPSSDWEEYENDYE